MMTCRFDGLPRKDADVDLGANFLAPTQQNRRFNRDNATVLLFEETKSMPLQARTQMRDAAKADPPFLASMTGFGWN